MDFRPDFHCFTWGEVKATGINPLQLRNVLRRGLGNIGMRRGDALFFFSFRELFVVDIMRQLDLMRIPVSQAVHLAVKAGRKLESVRDFIAEDRGTDFAMIIRFDEGETLIEYQRVDERRTPGTIPRPADTFIRVSLTGAFAKATQIAETAAPAIGVKVYA